MEVRRLKTAKQKMRPKAEKTCIVGVKKPLFFQIMDKTTFLYPIDAKVSLKFAAFRIQQFCSL